MISRPAFVVLAACFVACSALSWLFYSATERERVRFLVEKQFYAEAREQIATLKAKRQNHPEIAMPAPSLASKATPSKPPANPDWDPLGFTKALSQRPDLQNSRMEVTRALIRCQYQPLFDQLKLSDEQVRAFAENIAIQKEKSADIYATLADQHVPIGGPEAKKVYGELTAEFEAGQKKLLGESGFAAWKDYERGVYVRPIVAASAVTATLQGSPLSAAQLNDLFRAYLESSPTHRSGGPATDDIDWKTFEEKTRSFLSAAQQQAILQAQSARRTSMEFQKLVEKADQADRAGSR